MNKKKIFTYLFIGLLTAGATGTVTSCKDYDDDINNLQDQIDKAALKSDVEALKTQLASVESTANAAKTKAEENAAALLKKADQTYADQIKALADKAQATADEAGKTAANAVTAAANAQSTADDAVKAAKAANDLADAASKAAAENAAAIKANTGLINTNTANIAKIDETVKALNQTVQGLSTDFSSFSAQYKADLKNLQDAVKKLQDNSVANGATQADLNNAKTELTKNFNEALTKALTDAKVEIENKYATKADLKKVTDYLDGVKSVNDLTKEMATAQALKDSCATLEKKITAATDAQTKALETVVKAYKASVDQLFSALTGVELFATYSGTGVNANNLNDLTEGNVETGINLTMMHGLVPEDSKFGDNESGLNENADPIYPFVKGSDIKADGGVIVKVNPVNVDITKATVKLINSKGEVLDVVEAGTPVKYDALITRASANVGSGLWKIPFTVKNGVDDKAFEKATTSDRKEILYAVAICNTDSASNRYVSSTYDLGTRYKAYTPASKLDYSVNGTDVADIHNRWNGTWTKSENAPLTKDIKEYTWQNDKPATTAITEGDKMNVAVDASDARWDKDLLHVEVGQAFTIKLKAEENQPNKAQYYYVTLDENRAIESAPSELNAWKSYSYYGLLKNVAASSELSLKVNSAAANGDIIGFRVFAVNYDGTLQDPDGRAFYVQVGDAANAESVKGNVNVTIDDGGIASAASLADVNGKVTAKGNYVDIALTKSFLSSTDALQGTLDLDDATKDNLTSGSVYYILLDKDKKAAQNWEDAKYVRVGVNNPSAWTDGTSLTGTVKAMEAKTSTTAEYVKNSLTITVTKVLPQADDTKLTFRPKQEDVEGSGSFTMYLVPEGGSWNATPVKDNGTGNFDNVFYGLDQRITFTVDAAKYGDNDKVVALGDIEGTSTNNVVAHNFTVNRNFIDSKTYHNLTAVMNYGNISSKKKNGKLVPWTVAINQSMKVRFACWETANTYAWLTEPVKDKNGKQIGTKSYMPEITWAANGNYQTYPLGKIVNVTNTYDPARFSGNFEKLFITNPYLIIKDAKFTYGNQVNPYFGANIENGTLSIVKTQVENAPVADHDENLVFTVSDVYGHDHTISLVVKVLRPTGK